MGLWDAVKTGAQWATGIGEANWLANKAEGANPDIERQNVPQYNRQFNTFTDVAKGTQGRAAPQAADSDYSAYQSALLKGLLADSRGRGPGQQLVRMQAQQMADRGAQQQLAMARSARPGQSGMAGTNAAFNAANMQSQVGDQAAMAGLQARLGATQQLGQYAGQARGQDLQNNQFNADQQLRMYGLNDQTQLEALRQRLALSGMQQSGGMNYQQLLAAQPSGYERLFGALSGAGQTYAAMRGGG